MEGWIGRWTDEYLVRGIDGCIDGRRDGLMNMDR
jgi:hypothetical protein